MSDDSHTTIPLDLSVLIVDDSEDNLILYRIMLAKEELRLHFAVDGNEALDLVQNQPFDVIFMDLEMPRMGGLEATSKIRELESDTGREPARIIALTAYSSSTERQRCLDAGFNQVLSKPITKDRLIQVIYQK